MLLPISFLFSLAGVGLAGAAALRPDTGVDGTPGAFLALAGAVAVTALLGLLLVDGVIPARMRGIAVGLVLLIMLLTGIAAWFLMQTLLVTAMALSAAAFLASRAVPSREELL